MHGEVVYGLSYVQNLSYAGFFIAVAISGYLIPLPEEIILLLGGFLVAEGVLNLPFLIVVCILGAICGDSFIFYLSGHGGRLTRKYHKHVEKSHFGWYMRQMKKNPKRTIFISRFIVGMRFLNPVVSGATRVPWKIFFTYAALSAAIYTPLIILIGYFGSDKIGLLLHVAQSLRHAIILIIAAGTVVLTSLFIHGLWKKHVGLVEDFEV